MDQHQAVATVAVELEIQLMMVVKDLMNLIEDQ